MRNLIVQEFVSLDGVMQAPGGPDEDTTSGFKYGGWTAPYSREVDEEAGEFMKRWMESTDILLGRKTFDIFAAYWPKHEHMWPGIIDVKKYVMSNSMSQADVDRAGWKNSFLVKTVEDIKKLKTSSEGGAIKVHGSGNLAHTLFKHGLVDELVLMTFPVVLGKGKRLFGEDSLPGAFKMTDSLVTKNGVILAHYHKAGEIETGTVGA
jgi:dihydrofolate reductase